MAKFHIGRGGKAAVCSAKKGKCPYGSDEEHFKTREEAHAEAQKRLSKDNNILSGKKKDNENVKDSENIKSSTSEILETPKTPSGIEGGSELDEAGKQYAKYIADRIIYESDSGYIRPIMDEELYDKIKDLPYGDEYWVGIYNELNYSRLAHA